MKILGVWRNNRNFYDTHLSKVAAITAKAIYSLKPLMKHMNLKTRKEVITSKCKSIVNYGLELLFGQSDWVMKKFTAISMWSNRAIYRKDYFKVSNRRICEEIGVDEPSLACKKAAFRFIHKILRSQKPAQLYKMIKFNQHHRECSKIGLINPPSKEANKRILLVKSIELYNAAPKSLKILSSKQLNSWLKKVGDKPFKPNF